MNSDDSSEPQTTRKHEFELELDATPQQVWAALSEADEIIKWFAPEARVEPGVGGKIFLSWGPGMEGSSEISVWKPGEHLQTMMPAGSPDEQPPRIQVVDYLIEARGGKTVLRLVHSGFATDKKWDGEYESTHSGWLTFLAMLRHAVVEVPGVPATTSYRNLFLKVPREEIFERLTGEQGLQLRAAEMQDGGTFAAKFAGMPIHGMFPRMIANKCFILAAQELNGTLLAFFCESYHGQGMLTIQAVIYGSNKGNVSLVERGIASLCDTLFPEEERVSM